MAELAKCEVCKEPITDKKFSVWTERYGKKRTHFYVCKRCFEEGCVGIREVTESMLE